MRDEEVNRCNTDAKQGCNRGCKTGMETGEVNRFKTCMEIGEVNTLEDGEVNRRKKDNAAN